MAPLICLITPGHVSSAPRLVKEADALVDAGYRVHVVYGRSFPGADPLDASILGSARWQYSCMDRSGVAGAVARKILRRFSRRLIVHARLVTVRIAARAINAEALRLGAIAASLPAKLYVGHSLGGLPAAAMAARRRSSLYGFDAEDFHGAETDVALYDRAERLSSGLLQARLLGGCSHLTAAAPMISEQYVQVYRVHPRTVLNVFPLAQAPEYPVDPGPISDGRPARIYWFSQTIGPGRGLEAVVAALGLMRTPVELHLRGFPAPGYVSRLQELAARAGLARPVRCLQPGVPHEMARLASGADLGLSTEERLPPNRNLCLTNKIFIYLLAGIPQLLSDTAAQRALAPELGEAALLADLSEPGAVAARLDEFLSSPGRVAAARRKARELAAQRFCWDVEKSIFLESIQSVAPLSPGNR